MYKIYETIDKNTTIKYKNNITLTNDFENKLLPNLRLLCNFFSRVD